MMSSHRRGDRNLTPLARVLRDRVGGWRSQLLWRGLGVAIVAGFLHEYHWPLQDRFRSVPLSWGALREYLHARPGAEHAFTVAGILLVACGGRVASLCALALAAAWYLWVSTTHSGLFPAVELPIFVLLPTLACAAYASDHLRPTPPGATASQRTDATVVAVVRVTMVTSLAFAVLHKLNADFFDPQASCVREFGGWLAEAWGAPGELLASLASPLLIVLTETSILLALLLCPWVGIAVASGFFLLLGLVGASRIAVAMIAMSWAFLRDDDLAILRAQRRPTVVVIAVVATVAIAASLAVYRVRVLPRELIALLELVATTSAVAALAILTHRARRRRAGATATAGSTGPSPAHAVAPSHAVVAVAAAIWVVNAVSPYLGVKYNYSFAMWSNLRADESRWNSWVVPRAAQIVSVRDRYVDVEDVELAPPRLPFLPAGAVPVERFVAALEALGARAPVTLSLVIRYRGEEHRFDGGLDDPALRALVETMRDDAATDARHGRAADARPVLVRQAIAQRDVPYDPPYEQRLEPALFSPTRFRALVERLRRGGWNMHLRYRYGGQRHEVASSQDPEFRRWVASLTGDNLFPEKLDTDGTQRCIH